MASALHRLEPVSHLQVPRLELDGVPGVVAHGAEEPSREDEHAPQVMAIELAQLGEELPIDRHAATVRQALWPKALCPAGSAAGGKNKEARWSSRVHPFGILKPSAHLAQRA